MNNKEKELVVLNEMSYNICMGGFGDFSHINSNPELIIKRDRIENKRKGYSVNKDKMTCSLKNKRNGYKTQKLKVGIFSPEFDRTKTWTGRKHNSKTKEKMKNSHVGKHEKELNCMFNKMWITNGVENIIIDKNTKIPIGFYKGRKMSVSKKSQTS